MVDHLRFGEHDPKKPSGGSLGSDKTSRKKIENDREKDLAEKLGGFRKPASGAFQGMKGDIALDDLLMDSKSTVGELMSIGRKDVMKITKEAEGDGKDPALILTWINMPTTVEREWVAVPISVFMRMMNK
jgi:hypothetical protein